MASYEVVFRAYSGIYAQGSLLEVLREPGVPDIEAGLAGVESGPDLRGVHSEFCCSISGWFCAVGPNATRCFSALVTQADVHLMRETAERGVQP